MSTLNITDLLRELQAGEEARAKIPQLESTVAEYRKLSDDWAKHNQALELSILGYKATISDLTTKVARLEVERDDAGFRELEAQDKLTQMLDTMRDVGGMLGATIDRVSPPAPEPVPQPIMPDAAVSMTEAPTISTNVPITDHGAKRAVDPIASPVMPGSGNAVTSSGASSTENASQLTTTEQSPSSGQSDPLPTNVSASTVVEAQPQMTTAQESVMSNPQAYRPFGGDAVGPRPYHEKPDTTPWADWIAAGNEKPYWL